jgi:dolichyl-phosphate-mannose--protein O-mannosyl transferase
MTNKFLIFEYPYKENLFLLTFEIIKEFIELFYKEIFNKNKKFSIQLIIKFIYDNEHHRSLSKMQIINYEDKEKFLSDITGHLNFLDNKYNSYNITSLYILYRIIPKTTSSLSLGNPSPLLLLNNHLNLPITLDLFS